MRGGRSNFLHPLARKLLSLSNLFSRHEFFECISDLFRHEIKFNVRIAAFNGKL